jgi:hypothetical protein
MNNKASAESTPHHTQNTQNKGARDYKKPAEPAQRVNALMNVQESSEDVEYVKPIDSDDETEIDEETQRALEEDTVDLALAESYIQDTIDQMQPDSMNNVNQAARKQSDSKPDFQRRYDSSKPTIKPRDKQICFRMMFNGKCDKDNCTYSHDPAQIAEAGLVHLQSLKMQEKEFSRLAKTKPEPNK